MSNLVGQQVAHYQIKALLGQGRIGTVYQATDLGDQSPVALKVVSFDLTRQPEFRRRFLQEIQAIPRLDHPSIVKVHEAGIDTEHDTLYMTMDYVTERSLTAYVQQLKWRGEAMRPGEALLIGAQVAEALSYAHQKGVLHRDIRPNVILFRRDDESHRIGGQARRAVISDFTLATVLEEESEPFAGALPYMSPEQCLRQELDERTDIYSLGVVLYELVTGRLPYDIGSLDEAVRKHQHETPDPPSQLRPDLPPMVEEVIMRAIARQKADRFQTAHDFAQALRRTAAALPEALSASGPEEVVSSVDTNYEIPEQVAFQAIQWSSDEDRVTITQDVPYPLNRQIITIGRSENNDITLPSTGVTRRHAQLERTGSGWQIRDLGSKNGTYLDGHALLPDIPEEWLSHQSLRIGPYFLQLQQGKGFGYDDRPFEVITAPNEVTVQPGKQQTINASITNLGEETEEYKISVERLPPSWVALSDETVRVRAGQQQTTTITIRPPLDKGVKPGQSRYLLVVKPAAEDQKEVTLPGLVHIAPADNAFSAELTPTELTGKGTCHLVIHNESLADTTYTIIGHDPDDAIQFGQWRPKQESPANQTRPDRQPTASSSPLSPTRIPAARQLQRAPRTAVSRLLSGPRMALNRWLPGLGSMIRPEAMLRQRGRGRSSATAQSAPPPRLRPRDYDKVTFPGRLRTQAHAPVSQQQEVTLSIAPRKRPLLSRSTQSHPFQIQVSAPTGESQTLDGRLTLHPRLRTRMPPWFLVLLLLLLCGLASVLYISTVNPTVAALLSSPFDLDEDGLDNLTEVYVYRTDPNKADSDGDGLSDGQEIALDLSPSSPDTDHDGLLDGQEQEFSTNPRIYDTDGDELSDSLEVRVLKTDPLTANSLPIVLPATSSSPTPAPQPTAATSSSPTPTPAPSANEDTFTSIADQDGFIGQEANLGGLAIPEGESLQIGDDIGSGRQFKGIVSFDTSPIPDDAIIQSVRLRLRRSGSAGMPYNLGQIHIDLAPENGFSGDLALSNQDFNANAAIINVTTLSEADSNGSWAEGLLDASAAAAINIRGATQFRLYFTLPNDGNGDRDWINFDAGDHPNRFYRPQLIVTYALP